MHTLQMNSNIDGDRVKSVWRSLGIPPVQVCTVNNGALRPQLGWLCRRILDKCNTLLNFKPPLWGMGPLMQLYLAITCHAPRINYFTESLGMEDGGTVLLDWLEPPGSRKEAPVLLILHGVGTVSPMRQSTCREAALSLAPLTTCAVQRATAKSATCGAWRPRCAPRAGLSSCTTAAATRQRQAASRRWSCLCAVAPHRWPSSCHSPAATATWRRSQRCCTPTMRWRLLRRALPRARRRQARLWRPSSKCVSGLCTATSLT